MYLVKSFKYLCGEIRHYCMITILIITLLVFLFYCSKRMKRIREFVARPIISLTIIAIASVLFLVAYYNGRYYGLSPIIFNPLRLPQDVSIRIDRYYNFYIIGEDELEIGGPGFKMDGTSGIVESIQGYTVKDSVLYINCTTGQGTETYRLDKGELFCKAENIDNANWRTHLIENYEKFTFFRIMSVLLFLIGISLYILGTRRKCQR